MQTTIQNLKVSQRDISVQLAHISSQLRDNTSSADYQLIVQLVSEMSSRLYSNIKLLKDSKFHSLRNEFSSVRHSTSTHEHLPDKKIVVTIPADLELTEAETSVLSKGLTFVPVNNKIDEYQVKADCEKYFRRLRLKDGAYYCYCASVLRISRYSDYLSPLLTNTGIFLRRK